MNHKDNIYGLRGQTAEFLNFVVRKRYTNKRKLLRVNDVPSNSHIIATAE